jgi:hypothetical protein
MGLSQLHEGCSYHLLRQLSQNRSHDYLQTFEERIYNEATQQADASGNKPVSDAKRITQ